MSFQIHTPLRAIIALINIKLFFLLSNSSSLLSFRGAVSLAATCEDCNSDSSEVVEGTRVQVHVGGYKR